MTLPNINENLKFRFPLATVVVQLKTECFTGSRKMLGAENETIKLDKLGNKVTAVGGVCIGPETDISNLNSWIAAL